MRARNGLLRCLAIIGALTALPVVLGASTASAASSRVRVGETPTVPIHAFMVGATPASRKLAVTVELEPRDPVGLKNFATAVSTPGTPQYGHFLTVPQFASRFGATPAHVAAVIKALRVAGARVSKATRNSLQVQVSGTTGQLEKTFAVSGRQLRLPSGRVAHANNEPPTLPAGVAGYVQAVMGLDNVNPQQPAGAVRHTARAPLSGALRSAARRHPNYPTNGGPQPACSGAKDLQTGGAQGEHGLTADQVATAYQFSGLYGQGDLGQGQNVALFEEQPYNPTDVATYQACYGTSATLTNINVSGGPAPDRADQESALDIEQVIGLAPKANILVYQGPSTSAATILGAIVSANQAKVISSSYGLCEALTGAATINSEATLLQEAATQGQSFFISSGDSGSAMCFQATSTQANPNTSLTVIDPGGQPFATGVGGTFIFTGTDANPNYYTPGDPLVEAVWNEGYDGQRASGSGGGISSFFTMPSYQTSAPNSLGVVNADSSAQPCGGTINCREVPDVAADADPATGYAIFSSDSNGTANWGVSGGTSASAPLWAAFVALANASATCRGLPIGFANPSLYQIAGSSYNNNFNDVTHLNPLFYNQGNNGVTQSTANSNDALGVNGDKYQLRVGYDLATGLGSMIAPTLAASLCSARAPVYTVSVASPGNQTGTVGLPVSLAVHGSDSGSQTLTYSATGLPAGLSMSPAGVITGTPTTAQTATVTVSAADQFTNAGTTSFTWSVANPPPPPPPPVTVGKPSAQGAKVSGLGSGKPKLSFTLSAGAHAPALKSVAITLPKGLSFAAKAKTLAKGITLKSGNKKLTFTPAVKHGVLSIVFKAATPSASLTLAKPAITISKSEATAVRKHKVKQLVFKLKTTNASKQTTSLTVTLKKLS